MTNWVALTSLEEQRWSQNLVEDYRGDLWPTMGQHRLRKNMNTNMKIIIAILNFIYHTI